MQDISWHEDFFTRFFEEQLAQEHEDKTPMYLKHEHSLRVLAHARFLTETDSFAALAAKLPCGPAQAVRSTLLAALYHDIARFPQYLRWRTFRDKDSINHGIFGVKTLKQSGVLLRESPSLRRVVLAALALHNRYLLPPGLPQDVLLAANVVRDADKLDIFRIFAEQLAGGGPPSSTVLLSVKNDPALYTQKVLDDALARRVASYADLRSVNDFRILLGTWIYGLNFTESRKLLEQNGSLRSLLEDLPPLPALRAAQQQLLADLASPL